MAVCDIFNRWDLDCLPGVCRNPSRTEIGISSPVGTGKLWWNSLMQMPWSTFSLERHGHTKEVNPTSCKQGEGRGEATDIQIPSTSLDRNTWPATTLLGEGGLYSTNQRLRKRRQRDMARIKVGCSGESVILAENMAIIGTCTCQLTMTILQWTAFDGVGPICVLCQLEGESVNHNDEMWFLKLSLGRDGPVIRFILKCGKDRQHLD